MNIPKRPAWILVAAVAAAFLLGYGVRAILGGGSGGAAATAEQGAVWTCSMHPQVRMGRPGTCPICGMPLVPAKAAGAAEPGTLALSEAARATARVETRPVERRPLVKQIRAVGKVQANEAALATVTARVDGYVERLYADYTGMDVEKGDHLIDLYSPDLVVAQRELLLALEDASNRARLDAARLRLRRWDVSDAQIAELEATRRVSDRLTLHSTVRGTVVEKNVVEKSPVKAGDVLYRVADLRSVWVHLSLYEYEIGWVQHGQAVTLTTEAYPGGTFGGRVTFVSPILDEDTRSIRVRVNVSNQDRRLKPGMFVNARIDVPMRADGRPGPTGVEGKFTCPMHPEAIAEGEGVCPLCGMALRRIPGAPSPPEESLVLAVPASAVLDSGTRTLVYVERGPGRYAPVEVGLGPKAGDAYPVRSGLQAGDQVVVRGNFLLDSQFQIEGLPSLLSGKAPAPPPCHTEEAPKAPGPHAPKPPGVHKH